MPRRRRGDRVRDAACGAGDVSTGAGGAYPLRAISCERRERGENQGGEAGNLCRNNERSRGGELVPGKERRDGFVHSAGIRVSAHERDADELSSAGVELID